MALSKSYIPSNVLAFLSSKLDSILDRKAANQFLVGICGVKSFFDNEAELVALKMIITSNLNSDDSTNRREFGDYQTNLRLASNSIRLAKNCFDCEFLLEPTCGKGNFIIAALSQLNSISKIVGIEIYKPYVWETKYKVLSYYLENIEREIVDIEIIHEDVFSYDFSGLSESTKNMRTFVLGNPPWITNSELGSLDSINLPKKNNFQLLKGLDALTGKSNFDLGEAVLLNLFSYFQNHSGGFALLVKNIVIKNIVRSQPTNSFRIDNLHKYIINAKSEFNVSVNASLFIGSFNLGVSESCEEFEFYTEKRITKFGWSNGKFVSSIQKYMLTNMVDGKSHLVWRSGMKHDCSKIMELEKKDNYFVNKLGEEVFLEEGIVFRILKSSDLKFDDIYTSRKFTIVTQEKIGQSTSHIKDTYPKTYEYLRSNEYFLSSRKSSIYKGKPRFSIFGIGKYSFYPHKICISGLYKTTKFTYVGPDGDKPIMLDDTCYSIGFNSKGQAKIAQFLLNSILVQDFLESIVFSDSKRSINKDILMRIDLSKVYESLKFDDACKFDVSIDYTEWEKFGNEISSDSATVSAYTLF